MCIICNYLCHVLGVTRQLPHLIDFRGARPTRCGVARYFRSAWSTTSPLLIVLDAPDDAFEKLILTQVEQYESRSRSEGQEKRGRVEKQLTPEQFHVARQH